MESGFVLADWERVLVVHFLGCGGEELLNGLFNQLIVTRSDGRVAVGGKAINCWYLSSCFDGTSDDEVMEM
jgi:hypothetical protein